MSDIRVRGVTLSGRRAIALGVAFVALLLILGGGIPCARKRQHHNRPSPQVGRTTMICTTSAPLSAEARAKPRFQPSRSGGTRSTWLTEHIDAGHEINRSGRASQARARSPSDQLIDRYRGRWSQATASSAVIVGDVTGGNEAGSAAPCPARLPRTGSLVLVRRTRTIRTDLE
jgi:hypothetical protein